MLTGITTKGSSGVGRSVGTAPVIEVDPSKAVSLDTEISPPAKSARLSIHLLDDSGTDRGALQEVQVSSQDNH
jgi:hypothetical protein